MNTANNSTLVSCHATSITFNIHDALVAGGWSYYWNWKTDETVWERPTDGLRVHPLKDGYMYGEW